MPLGAHHFYTAWEVTYTDFHLIFQNEDSSLRMSAIKTFLNCSHLDKNIELQLTWNARKQLALKTHDGFGLDLSKIVTRIQAEICGVELSAAALNSRDCMKSVGTKIDLITEIEAAKGNFLFRQPELNDCTLQVGLVCYLFAWLSKLSAYCMRQF